MRALLLAFATLATLAAVHANARDAAPVPGYIISAVADPARPEADRDRDANRKPAETLVFAGVKPGQTVVDLLPGQGYFTRIFSAVVGPGGHVYAVVPPARANSPRDFAAMMQPVVEDAHYGNVTLSVQTLTGLSLPQVADVIWTSQNYHDFHNIPDADVVAIDKAIFNALKPGGTFIVLDHAAEPGSGARDTSTLHRIDPETVRKEVLAAGFKLVGESRILRNPDDPHTAKVFDPAIRGRTDQFIFKFRKPR